MKSAPAFPLPDSTWADMIAGNASTGLTKREWYAGHVIAAMVGSLISEGISIKEGDAEVLAKAAWAMADAMIVTKGD